METILLLGLVGTIVLDKIFDNYYLLFLSNPSRTKLDYHVLHDPFPSGAVESLFFYQLETVASGAVLSRQ